MGHQKPSLVRLLCFPAFIAFSLFFFTTDLDTSEGKLRFAGLIAFSLLGVGIWGWEYRRFRRDPAPEDPGYPPAPPRV